LDKTLSPNPKQRGEAYQKALRLSLKSTIKCQEIITVRGRTYLHLDLIISLKIDIIKLIILTEKNPDHFLSQTSPLSYGAIKYGSVPGKVRN
jgi:hypothetical protein